MIRSRACTLALATLLTACVSNDTGGITNPGTPLDISGAWAFTGSMENAILPATCQMQGTATITQSGGTIGGSASRIDSCTIAATHPADTVATTIDSGTVTGATASFKIGTCRYVGAITGTPTTQIGGSTTCVLSFSGAQDTVVGTFHASR